MIVKCDGCRMMDMFRKFVSLQVIATVTPLTIMVGKFHANMAIKEWYAMN